MYLLGVDSQTSNVVSWAKPTYLIDRVGFYLYLWLLILSLNMWGWSRQNKWNINALYLLNYQRCGLDKPILQDAHYYPSHVIAVEHDRKHKRHKSYIYPHTQRNARIFIEVIWNFRGFVWIIAHNKKTRTSH